MPTYEFVCPAGHTFDKFFRTISAGKRELPCPECGRPATRKVSGGAGLVFKGSGFYITDYGKDGKKKPDSARPAESGAGSGASEGARSDAPASSAGTTKPEPASKKAEPTPPKRSSSE